MYSDTVQDFLHHLSFHTVQRFNASTSPQDTHLGMLPEQKQSFQTFVCVQFMRVHVFTFKCIDLSVCVCSQTSLYIYTSTCFYIQAYVSIIVFYMNFAAPYLYNTRKILFIVLKAAYSICIDMFYQSQGFLSALSQWSSGLQITSGCYERIYCKCALSKEQNCNFLLQSISSDLKKISGCLWRSSVSTELTVQLMESEVCQENKHFN